MYLTHEDIRTYLVDSNPDDNELLDDIDFKPAQIGLAMKLAAAAFNKIAPYSLVVEGNRLPLDEWAILAVQEQLYRMRLNQLERNAVQLQAGNTSYDADGTRIQNLRAALQRLPEWRRTAYTLKQNYNASMTYGDLG